MEIYQMKLELIWERLKVQSTRGAVYTEGNKVSEMLTIFNVNLYV